MSGGDSGKTFRTRVAVCPKNGDSSNLGGDCVHILVNVTKAPMPILWKRILGILLQTPVFVLLCWKLYCSVELKVLLRSDVLHAGCPDNKGLKKQNPPTSSLFHLSRMARLQLPLCGVGPGGG